MDVNITFLGTSNAIPTEKRNHTAILLTHQGENILFDCGEGTQRQAKVANINLCKLTRICLTHMHGDHTLGLPGLIKSLEMSEYSRTLKIYGPIGTKKHFQLLQELYGRFNIKHEIHEVSGTFVNEKEFQIHADRANHTTHTNIYSFIIKEKTRLKKDKIKALKIPNSPLLGDLARGKTISLNGKKINPKSLIYKEPEKKISIILDTKFEQHLIKHASNSDLLICEATYSDEEKEKAEEYRHLTFKQAAEIAKRSKSKQLILTHISQKHEFNLKTLLAQTKKTFKNTSIASDLQTIAI